jgi:hypothetical protein
VDRRKTTVGSPLDAAAELAILAQPTVPLPPLATLASLEPGEVALLVAPAGILAQAEAALILEAARLGPVLIFTDGAPLNAYALLSLARAQGIPEKVADRVIIARLHCPPVPHAP